MFALEPVAVPAARLRVEPPVDADWRTTSMLME
jgi:hypothetical protein